MTSLEDLAEVSVITFRLILLIRSTSLHLIVRRFFYVDRQSVYDDTPEFTAVIIKSFIHSLSTYNGNLCVLQTDYFQCLFQHHTKVVTFHTMVLNVIYNMSQFRMNQPSLYFLSSKTGLTPGVRLN